MTRKQTEPAVAPHPSHPHGTDAGAVAGELVGAILGSVAGPVGTVAGMVVGALAGALTGHVLEEDVHRARLHDEELDETIGVSGGDIGAARPPAPPAATPPAVRRQRAPAASLPRPQVLDASRAYAGRGRVTKD